MIPRFPNRFQHFVSNDINYCSRNLARDIFHNQVGLAGVLTKEDLNLSEAEMIKYYFQINAAKSIGDKSRAPKKLPYAFYFEDFDAPA